MATVALAVIGNAILPGIGGLIGGMVGSYIDSAYVFPALFGSAEVPEPKLDDLGVQTASEGAPIKYCLGPRCRIAGNLIWLGDTIIVTKEEKSGGKGGGGSKVTITTYFRSFAVLICEAPQGAAINRIVKVRANTTEIYDDDLSPGFQEDVRYTSITFYDGSQTTPDPLIVAKEGSAPSWNGYAYCVVESLILGDFGNQVPQLNFEVEEAATRTVASAIQEIYKRSGRPVTDIDVTGITGNLRGYVVSGPVSVIKQLEVLMNTFNITAQERGGVIYFFHKTDAAIRVIAADQMGAHESGRGSRVPVPLERTPPTKLGLPKMITLQYVNEDFNLERGEVKERRSDSDVWHTQTLNMPITLTQAEARQLAGRILWTGAGEAPIRLFLPPSEYGIQSGDLLQLTYLGNTLLVRVNQALQGANYLIEVDGVALDLGAYDTSQFDFDQGTPADANPSGPYTPPPTTLHVLDLAPLSTRNASVIGTYWAIAATSPSARAPFGFTLYESVDDSFFVPLGSTSIESIMGSTDTALGNGPVGYWDQKNTVDVTLINGTLTSVTEIQVLRDFRNLALIGNEIIFFQTVTSLGGSSFRLSKLLRGKRNTEQYTVGHGSSERFILLDTGLNFSPQDSVYIGNPRYYKGVPTLGDPAIYSSVSVSPVARTLVPFAPCYLQGYRSDSGDVLIGWMRRSRAVGSIFGPGGSPQLEGTEKYQLDITSGSGRTFSVVNRNYQNYSVAQQTEDGLTLFDPIDIEVYQVSDLVGLGKMTSGTI